MAASKTTWVYNPPKPKMTDSVKLPLKDKADKLIEEVLKPKHIQPPLTDNDFNYLVDIFTKWYRNFFYFCGKYNCPSPKAISPSFETKFARMEYTHEGKYNVSYMRHTGQWWEIYQNLDEDECFDLIAKEPHFIP